MPISQAQLIKLQKVAEAKNTGPSMYLRGQLVGGKKTKYTVVILPDPTGGDDWMTQGRTHYFNSIKANGTCPAHFDIDCPACETFYAGISTYHKTDGWEHFKKLGPNPRVHFNVFRVDTGEFLIWSLPCNTDQSYGAVLSDEILQYALKTPSVDVTDVLKGRPLDVVLTPNGASFKWGGTFQSKNKKLPAAAKDWKNKVHDLTTVPHQRILTKDQLEEAVEYYTTKADDAKSGKS